MRVNQLTIPKSLCQLLQKGVWPHSEVEGRAQNISPILGRDVAHRISPEDDQIILMVPPFHTIADEVAQGNNFWTESLTNVAAIDYSKAIIIAHFGLGSDSPIILYYEGFDQQPKVMYLKWSFTGCQPQHHWVTTHACFDAFVRDVGLQ